MIPCDRILIDHEYHIIELHNIMVPDEVFDWLFENCGDGSDGRWFLKHPRLYFRNSRDHLMFTLRWS